MNLVLSPKSWINLNTRTNRLILLSQQSVARCVVCDLCPFKGVSLPYTAYIRSQPGSNGSQEIKTDILVWSTGQRTSPVNQSACAASSLVRLISGRCDHTLQNSNKVNRSKLIFDCGQVVKAAYGPVKHFDPGRQRMYAVTPLFILVKLYFLNFLAMQPGFFLQSLGPMQPQS